MTGSSTNREWGILTNECLLVEENLLEVPIQGDIGWNLVPGILKKVETDEETTAASSSMVER